MNENMIANLIMDAAFLIHRELGPGLLESVYEVVLAKLLTEKGLAVQRGSCTYPISGNCF